MLQLKTVIKNKNIQSLTVNFAGAGLGFLNYALTVRLFSKEIFGIWVLIFTIINILDFLRAGLILPALMKFLPGIDKENKNKIIGTAWLIGLIITCLIIIGLKLSESIIVFFDFVSINFTQYLFWVLIIFSSTFPFYITYWKLQSNRAFGRMLFISLLKVGGFTLILLYNYYDPKFITSPLLHQSTHLDLLFWFYFINSSIVSVFCIITGWSGISYLKYATPKTIKKLFNFGKYTLGNVINHSLLRASDTYMIAIFMGTHYVAVYDVALSILKLFEVILRSFFANFHPKISEAFNHKKINTFITLIKENTKKLFLLFLTLGVVVIIVAKYLIMVLAGNNYEDSALILIILAVYSFIVPFNRLINVILECLEKTKIIFNISVFCVGINILGNYFGILLFKELWVVAIVTVIVTLFNFFLSGYYLKIISKKTINKEVSVLKILLLK